MPGFSSKMVDNAVFLPVLLQQLILPLDLFHGALEYIQFKINIDCQLKSKILLSDKPGFNPDYRIGKCCDVISLIFEISLNGHNNRTDLIGLL